MNRRTFIKGLLGAAGAVALPVKAFVPAAKPGEASSRLETRRGPSCSAIRVNGERVVSDSDQAELCQFPVRAWITLVSPDGERLMGMGDYFPTDARRGWACACGEYNGDATFCCGKCGGSR